MNRSNLDRAMPRPLLQCLPVLAIALSVACSGRSANTSGASSDSTAAGGGMDAAGAANVAGGSSGSADTTNGSPGGSSGSSGALSVGSKCGDVPPPLMQELPEPSVTVDPNATLKEIVISGAASTAAGLGASLEDQGVYSDGSVRYLENITADINYHSQVVWTSSDLSIANVASGDSRDAGGVQAFYAGTVIITAAVGSVSKSVCFVVTPPVVARLSISAAGSEASNVPAPVIVMQGDTAPLACTELLTDGTKVDVTKTVAWASSDPAIATISSGGVASGLTAGTSTLTVMLPASVPAASPEDLTATAMLDVIGSTGLQQGASCGATPQACAAGLTCCPTGRFSSTSSCMAPLSPQFPCPMYP